MSDKVRFELDIGGLNELMKSAEMQAILEDASSQVEAAAGDGFGHRVGVATYTAIGNVFADSKESAKKAYQENTLLKALGSAGLGM